MQLASLVLMLLSSASALVVSPLAAHASSSRVAASPYMACNGGKGGSGGMNPKLDKWRRGAFKKLVQAPESAEEVQAILLSSQTERLIMKMNWKVRKHCKVHLEKRAAQFGVEVPKDFAGLNVLPRNTPKHKLVASIKTPSPAHPKAVAAIAKVVKF